MVTFNLRRIAPLVVFVAFAGAPVRAAAGEQRAGALSAGEAAGGWDMALTGGFVACGLVDPVWALGSLTGQPTRVVVRQPDQESTANLGVAMFGQVYHDRYRWIAPLSFGLGIRGDSRATFYLGSALPSARTPRSRRASRSAPWRRFRPGSSKGESWPIRTSSRISARGRRVRGSPAPPTRSPAYGSFQFLRARGASSGCPLQRSVAGASSGCP